MLTLTEYCRLPPQIGGAWATNPKVVKNSSKIILDIIGKFNKNVFKF